MNTSAVFCSLHTSCHANHATCSMLTRPLNSRTSFYGVHVECLICLSGFFHSKEASCVKCFLEESISIESKWTRLFRNHIICRFNPSFHRLKTRSIGRVIIDNNLIVQVPDILLFNLTIHMLPFNLFELIVTLLRGPYAKTMGNLKLEYEITSGNMH